ncbi:MAG: AEC family transporter, partial [SAR324 cluster bacterium]
MENIGGIFLVFLNVVTPVFILVVIGYFVGPRLKIDARSLSRTAYFVFIPAFVFNIISEAKIDSELALQMLSFILVAQIAVALLGFLVGKALRQSREITAAFVLIATFGNVGNFGLPLIVFRWGETARTFATVYFVATVFISFVICVGVASWARSGGVTAVFSVFKTPALIALIPALVFNITDVEVPIFLSRLSGLLGQAMIPVMLITLGVQMGEIPKIKINFNVFAASTVRLIGGPVLALLIVPYFGLEGLERSTGILQAAMPAAVLASIIALEYKLLPE